MTWLTCKLVFARGELYKLQIKFWQCNEIFRISWSSDLRRKEPDKETTLNINDHRFCDDDSSIIE